MQTEWLPFFKEGVSSPRTLWTASAPGRLDVMGGIADYSGSLLLQMPIREAATVKLAVRGDDQCRIFSQQTSELFSCELSGLKTMPLAEAGQYIRSLPAGDWAAYPLGCYLVLWQAVAHEEELAQLFKGFDLWVSSSVPAGKGVSSSAALEVATMKAFCECYGIRPEPLQLPLWAQQAENQVASAPCGLMDQLSVYLGREGALLPIICQPAEVFPVVPLPEEVFFVGIDSGVRHEVGGAADYGTVRAAAFMGYSILACHQGVSPEQLFVAMQAEESRERLPWHGYLANIGVEEMEKRLISLLPEQLSGADFLERYGAHTDPVTPLQPGRVYPVHAAALHPVYENDRINRFLEGIGLLGQSTGSLSNQLSALGTLMYASHRGYTSCGLGSAATDLLVEAVHQAGPANGVFGARITGGGSGGTVCVLCNGEHGLNTVHDIAARHAYKMGAPVKVFSGSSEGAAFRGVERQEI